MQQIEHTLKHTYTAKITVTCNANQIPNMMADLKEGEDYYINEQGLMVFKAKYHLKRGYCCQNGCRHCPYGFKNKGADAKRQQQKKD